jgi:hypothetical protein
VDSGKPVSRVTIQDCISRDPGDGTGLALKGCNGITVVNFDDNSRECSVAISGEGVGAKNIEIRGTAKMRAPKKWRVGNGAPPPRVSG